MTLSQRKKSIKHSFSKANSYEENAFIQKKTAYILKENIRKIIGYNSIKEDILEIGCGTGLLSHYLFELFPHAHLFCTDISSQMLIYAQQKLKETYPHIRSQFFLMDGEKPKFNNHHQKFFLMVSNLCIQWFENRSYAFKQLDRYLQKNGYMIFSTLVKGSLEEWRQSCINEKLPCGIMVYPTCKDLQKEWPSSGIGQWHTIKIKEKTNAYNFLKKLKKIGASLPQQDYKPLKANQLKKIMISFDKNFNEVTYYIGIGIFKKK